MTKSAKIAQLYLKDSEYYKNFMSVFISLKKGHVAMIACLLISDRVPSFKVKVSQISLHFSEVCYNLLFATQHRFEASNDTSLAFQNRAIIVPGLFACRLYV